MKTRVTVLSLLILGLLVTAVPATADSILYNNGPDGGDIDAWTISSGFAVSDSFTLAGDGSITGFQFWAWLFPGDSLASVEVSITSQEFGGTTYFDQTVPFVSLGCYVGAYGYNVCDESANLNVPRLNAGTYWINLQNASVANGDPVYWDENSGRGCESPGCPSLASENSLGTIPSESFTLLGNGTTGTGSSPEPGTIVLFGSGLLGLAAVLWRAT